MTIAFDRPTGANADVKELEYISALHQTDPNHLRSDASIQDVDVARLLMSRQGIKVKIDTVRKFIMSDLGGDLVSEPNPELDLCQIASLLLIPHLRKLSAEQDYDLFETILQEILIEALGDDGDLERKPKLTGDLLRDIFESYGEVNISEEVIQEMLAAAGATGRKTDHDDGEAVLDVNAFVRALTSDLSQYGLDWDQRLTTHYEDVPVFKPQLDRAQSGSRNLKLLLSEDESDSEQNGDEENPASVKPSRTMQPPKEQKPKFKRVYTAPTIDTIADTYRSQSFAVILWVALVVTYMCYLWQFDNSSSRLDCDRLSSFGCQVVNGIIVWLVIFLQLSVLGSTFIVLASAGNALLRSRRLSILGLCIGMASLVVTTILPFIYQIKTPVVSTEKNDDVSPAYYASVFLGSLLIFLQLVQLTSLLWTKFAQLKTNRCFGIFLTAGARKMEHRTKLAATKKVGLLVNNAMKMHVHSTHTITSQSIGKLGGMVSQANALKEYHRHLETKERVGGVWWGWKKIWDKTIFSEEGVWLHSRLIASTFAQFFIFVLLLITWSIALGRLDELAGAIEDAAAEGDDPLVRRWEVAFSGSVGIILGLLATASIALVYIPSSISTVLKFRSGVIPSLHSSKFLVYRMSIDQTCLLFGSAFWGCLATGTLCTALVGIVVFLAVWHETRYYVAIIFAQIIGIAVTVILKMLILCLLRKLFMAGGYYRKNPAAINYMNVALECWNLGLSTGYVLARMTKLLLATAFYIGRIGMSLIAGFTLDSLSYPTCVDCCFFKCLLKTPDTPFLAPDVEYLGPMALDAYPMAFRKDLLAHEAHRHPYLERLCTLYMMKLRFGDDFAKKSGSCWRLLFVLALMPWLQNYRVCTPVEPHQLLNNAAVTNTPVQDGTDEEDDDKEKTVSNGGSFGKINDSPSRRREELLEGEVRRLRVQVNDLQAQLDDAHNGGSFQY